MFFKMFFFLYKMDEMSRCKMKVWMKRSLVYTLCSVLVDGHHWMYILPNPVAWALRSMSFAARFQVCEDKFSGKKTPKQAGKRCGSPSSRRREPIPSLIAPRHQTPTTCPVCSSCSTKAVVFRHIVSSHCPKTEGKKALTHTYIYIIHILLLAVSVCCLLSR